MQGRTAWGRTAVRPYGLAAYDDDAVNMIWHNHERMQLNFAADLGRP